MVTRRKVLKITKTKSALLNMLSTENSEDEDSED
jgi:hypothetical protein